MSVDKNETNRTGIGFAGILTIIFVLAKIFDKIDWSWWWVFSPIWIPAGIIVGCLSIGIFLSFIIALISAIFDN